MQEIYVSTDIEADGPIPGVNSMMSLGSVAFTADGKEVGQYYVKLTPLIGAKGNAKTMEWWKTQPIAFGEATTDARLPAFAMEEYAEWLRKLPGKPVFVGYPAGYDFTFVYWYLIKFTGSSPFGFSALDIKSYAMAVLKLPFRETAKRNMPAKWFPETKHSHIAVEDAREQGLLFINMLKQQTMKDVQ